MATDVRHAAPTARVLFACVANAGRSQMAAAFFNKFSDPNKAEAISAGTRPASAVHPEVIRAMAEEGVDLSDRTPRMLSADLAATASLLITMGCGDECPYVPGAERVDWPLDDPKGQSIENVRRIRDDIKARVRRLIDERRWQPPSQR